MKLKNFKVSNYRNIKDSGFITITDVTAFVGQNEAGKSNLFDALFCINPYVDGANYDIEEDWPVDEWPNKKSADGTEVCVANFTLTESEIGDLYETATLSTNTEEGEEEGEESDEPDISLPELVTIQAAKSYGYQTVFHVDDENISKELDPKKVDEWAKNNCPKFVLINDYQMSGAQVELNELKARLDAAGGEAYRHKLSADDQTIMVVLDLAQIDLTTIIEKGTTSEGRTSRSFDRKSASKHLSNQFRKLWSQKRVEFTIDIDATTLNIFVEDENVGMPVRLHRRSTGFRWYVSFAWKFTHASQGEYENCILLLEEPGVHLHYQAQRDLLEVLDGLSATNTILYTTHLASMIDQANPERVRIVESHNNHLAIKHGVVASGSAPMAVIEMSVSDLSLTS